MLSSDHRTDRANADGSSGLTGEVGEDRGVHRLGEDRVRREEEHERHLVRDGAALHAVADDDRGAEQQADHRVLEHRPPRQTYDATHVVVVATRARGTSRTPLRQHGDERDAHERGDAEGSADREDERLAGGEVDASGRDRSTSAEHDHRHDGDDRVADRRDRRHGEVALRVEHRHGDRADRVEHHLRDEEPQQQRRQLLLLARLQRLVDAPRQQVGDPRCREDPDHRDHAEEQQGDPQQPAGEALHAARRRRGRAAPTNVGTSTADSAPAATSSNSTFETELLDWYALPR